MPSSPSKTLPATAWDSTKLAWAETAHRRQVGDESTEDPDEEDESSDEEEALRSNSRDCSPKVICFSISGGCCLLLLITVLVLMYVGSHQVNLSQNIFNQQDPTINPIMYPRWNNCAGCEAGNKTDEQMQACAEPCYSVKYLLDWEQLSKEAGYKLVYFPSRVGPKGEPPVNISAWWMPPPPRPGFNVSKAPRIVAFHGLASNYNSCGVQASCFLLRQLGFGCLAPTVRDYGLSGKSSHPRTLSWGYDYPFDLLGAWDYAVNDPDGLLGGPLSDGQVGIMGFSKGALGVGIAFGLEPRIRGAWLDSAPYCGLRGMIKHSIRPYLGVFAALVAVPVIWGAELYSETPIDYYDPFKLLANCSAPARYAAVSQGLFDTDVPLEESQRMTMLLGSLKSCYTLTTYTPPEYCNTWTHHHEMWEFPDEMRQVLCTFWSDALGSSPEACRLSSLPAYQKWTAPWRLPPGTPDIASTLAHLGAQYGY